MREEVFREHRSVVADARDILDHMRAVCARDRVVICAAHQALDASRALLRHLEDLKVAETKR